MKTKEEKQIEDNRGFYRAGYNQREKEILRILMEVLINENNKFELYKRLESEIKERK